MRHRVHCRLSILAAVGCLAGLACGGGFAGGVEYVVAVDLTGVEDPEATLAATEACLEERLDEAGLRGAAGRRGADRVFVQVEGQLQPDDSLFRPGRLEFYRVDEDWSPGRFMPVLAALEPSAATAAAARGAHYTQAAHSAGVLPVDRSLLWPAEFEDDGEALVVFVPPVLWNDHVKEARAGDDDWGGPYVALEFTEEGGEIFHRVTAEMVSTRLAIAVDGEVFSAPVVQEAIAGGRARITMGMGPPAEREAEAEALAATLRTGPLPAPVKLAEVRTVGPAAGSGE